MNMSHIRPVRWNGIGLIASTPKVGTRRVVNILKFELKRRIILEMDIETDHVELFCYMIYNLYL